MRTWMTNANVFTKSGFEHHNLVIDDHRIRFVDRITNTSSDIVIDFSNLYLIPGFVDVHVHLREPGFLYKEDIGTGSKAAAHGGYTAICCMPNVKPAPDTKEHVLLQWQAIEEKAQVRVYPYGSITKDQCGKGVLSDMEDMKDYVIAYSDDGVGVQGDELMEQAMRKARKLDKIIVAHCEDEKELVKGGCIHDGAYARKYNHIGINSASEYKQVQRDVNLAKITGCSYHVCHVSTKESVEIIRKAKKEGVRVTCETGPHYLMYTTNDLEEDGKWKMNPPLRDYEDRKALCEGILDGTIDCIITDHAPHSKEEKALGLDGSKFGIVGLETCFGAMYKNLVLNNPLDPSSHKGLITLEKLIELMCINPRKIFHIPGPMYIEDDCIADFTVLDLNKEWIVDPSKFYSKGRSTLFEGKTLQGEVVQTYVNGIKVYDNKEGMMDIHGGSSTNSD